MKGKIDCPEFEHSDHVVQVRENTQIFIICHDEMGAYHAHIQASDGLETGV